MICHIGYGQEWESKTLSMDPRIVHSMAINDLGTYIVGGRLFNGKRSPDLVLVDRDQRYLQKKALDARDGHSCFIDDNNQLMVFGGHSNDAPLNDLWKYNNDAWERIDVKGERPKPRWAHASIFFKGSLWVCSGKGSGQGNFFQDMWSWNGISWKKHESKEKPEPRYGAHMGIYNDQIILYGGRDHSGNWYTDTWVWRNEGWEKIATEHQKQPKASVGHVLVTTKNALYLIGGIWKGNTYPEMWKFNGSSWELINNSLPFHLDFPAGAYDPKKNSIVVTGSSNDTFQYWSYQLD